MFSSFASVRALTRNYFSSLSKIQRRAVVSIGSGSPVIEFSSTAAIIVL